MHLNARAQTVDSALTNLPDTAAVDTSAAQADTLDVPVSKSALTSPVHYSAKDSSVFDIANKKLYLYGDAHIDYQDLILDAAFITIDWTKNEIYAEGMPDSSGKLAGTPIFKQGEEKFESKKMAYNFTSKKGRITELITEEGEGYIHGEIVKTKLDGKEEVIYARNGKYTTCNLRVPHYYIATNKLKLIPKDKVITGPAVLKVEGVPIPLVLPFGFFPANSRKSSGIILPTYGESATQGFVLRNLGYYFGYSDYYDLALTGDIYTGGSYRVNALTRYAKRYKFNGGLSVSYARNQLGLKETPDFNVEENFFVRWNHSQDVKARPGTTFSADVSAGSSSYLDRNTYNVTDLTRQNLNSSVAFSKRFGRSPFSLNTALNHSQNLGTGEVLLAAPNMNFGMSRIYPFKNKKVVERKWYNDVGVTYNLEFRNQLNTSDSTFTQDLNLDKFRNGFHQSIPLSTSLKILKYFSLSPVFNYDGFLYTKKNILAYDTANKEVVTETTNGMFYAQQWSTSAVLTTNVYGMFKVNRGRIMAVRHVLTPSITGTYKPDFADPRYGYYSSYHITQGDSIISTVPYFQYDNGIIGAPSAGKQGTLGISLNNNIEMKVKGGKDTSAEAKKIKIFDFLNLSGAYNFLDTLNPLSVINVDARTTLFERLSLQGGIDIDPYTIDTLGRKTKTLYWDAFKKPGRLTAANLNVSTSLNRQARERGQNGTAPYFDPITAYYYPMAYADFNIPWNLSFGYNLGYFKPAFTENILQTIEMTGELNLTSKWKLNVRTGYDIKQEDFTITEINIYRDLHCWEMSMRWIPFGANRSYLFNIHIKASSLQDLKLEKRKDFYDY